MLCPKTPRTAKLNTLLSVHRQKEPYQHRKCGQKTKKTDNNSKNRHEKRRIVIKGRIEVDLRDYAATWMLPGITALQDAQISHPRGCSEWKIGPIRTTTPSASETSGCACCDLQSAIPAFHLTERAGNACRGCLFWQIMV